MENAAETVLLGWIDKEGNYMLRVGKCKDGIKGKAYKLAWNTNTCSFLGELDAVHTDDAPVHSQRRPVAPVASRYEPGEREQEDF